MATVDEQAKRIYHLVCGYFEVPPERVMSKTRKARYLQPRQVCMYIFRHRLAMSLSHIGDFFGGRDHTTVIHAVRQIENCLVVGDYLANDVRILTNIIEKGDYIEETKLLVKVPKEVDFMQFVSDITENYRVQYTIV